MVEAVHHLPSRAASIEIMTATRQLAVITVWKAAGKASQVSRTARRSSKAQSPSRRVALVVKMRAMTPA